MIYWFLALISWVYGPIFALSLLVNVELKDRFKVLGMFSLCYLVAYYFY